MEDFGRIQAVMSDNGSQFVSEIWWKFWQKQRVEVRYTSPCRPASNPVERVMATTGDVICLYASEKQGKWPDLLKDIEKRITETIHKSTELALIQIIEGTEPVCPIGAKRKIWPHGGDGRTYADLALHKLMQILE